MVERALSGFSLLDWVVGHFKGVKRSGSEYSALCPAPTSDAGSDAEKE
jgi:hypothetical protein